MFLQEGPAVDRREFLGGATAVAAIVVSGAAIIHTGEAWGLEVTSLKPETMRSLVKMARDIFPHDKLADKYYAVAVKSYDTKSAKDPAIKSMIEGGIARLDTLAVEKHGVPYAAVGWEKDRVAMLREISADKMFQSVRGNLVVSLYNQKEIWPLFGYEGESAAYGGYIARGFDDIAWL